MHRQPGRVVQHRLSRLRNRSLVRQHRRQHQNRHRGGRLAAHRHRETVVISLRRQRSTQPGSHRRGIGIGARRRVDVDPCRWTAHPETVWPFNDPLTAPVPWLGTPTVGEECSQRRPSTSSRSARSHGSARETTRPQSRRPRQLCAPPRGTRPPIPLPSLPAGCHPAVWFNVTNDNSRETVDCTTAFVAVDIFFVVNCCCGVPGSTLPCRRRQIDGRAARLLDPRGCGSDEGTTLKAVGRG